MPRLFIPRLYGTRLFGPLLFGGGAEVPPGVPTVTWTDNADGTGATVAVDGDDGAENAIYTWKWDDDFAGGSWVNAGNLSGDGSLDMPLTPGAYWGYVMSSNAAGAFPSVPEYFMVTTGAESYHYRCLHAVRTRIGSAGLVGLDVANLVVQYTPLARDFLERSPGAATVYELPGIIISPWGAEAHDPDAGTNVSDEWGWPCLVTIIAAQNNDLTANLEARLKWRQQAMLACTNQRLPGLNPEQLKCVVEPQTVVDLDSFGEEFFHSSFVVRVQAWHRRGLGL